MALIPIPLRSWNTIIPDMAREILTDRLTARMRLRGVYPVLFTLAANNSFLLGWCDSIADAPDGDLSLTPAAASTSGILLDTYVHELAHRLICAVDFDFRARPHTWTFAAMNAVLLRRVEGHIVGSRPRIQSLKLYDVHDEAEENWGWAMQRALDVSAELAPLPISAEECAEKIWRIWFDDRHPSMRAAR